MAHYSEAHASLAALKDLIDALPVQVTVTIQGNAAANGQAPGRSQFVAAVPDQNRGNSLAAQLRQALQSGAAGMGQQ